MSRENSRTPTRQILQFPVLFLGAKPQNTPAFYNFMNFADFGLGTWHPDKGMYSIVEGMASLGKELGVIFHTNSPVKHILVNQGRASGIETQGKTIKADFVLSGADYHHTKHYCPQSIAFTAKIIGQENICSQLSFILCWLG